PYCCMSLSVPRSTVMYTLSLHDALPICGLGSLLGQRLHFGGDHGEAAARLAGTRRLDRGVERQQVGLAGNGVDQFDHVADPCRRSEEHTSELQSCENLVCRLLLEKKKVR